jgi:hypothetical protein
LLLTQNGIVLFTIKTTILKYKTTLFKTAKTYHGHLAVFAKVLPILEQITMS